ncbi:PspC domain-containing protein [Antarcticibacterium arcticum]|uniref:PspC domain-containing protein n=1 Tax=Antarcticibacterium arcticum TaxID=2585771 RepID=A0A5B8YHK0_9FLAO|nr:PspC domain-containing protein [Antarcticibacterium arcticum]QED37315.1 PspC domain-containing protein [Antarcticibacterium arcticum]
MNKTVNINLAGVFFHIDENAYTKLQHYLDAIKRSLTNTQGQDEIIADIEARIAELFNEKIKTDRQVIGSKEVDEVIAVLGQPEDYMLDEEIFEDEPVYNKTRSTGKQLFRDTEHSYVGGVSSGLGHYLGIAPIWVRILWIILTLASSGAFILIYIALWIFVPEAKTTADKLSMRGEEVNISNIERKIREEFENVSGRMKNVDYEKYGNQARSGATSAAKGVGSGILFLLNIFVKLIGVLILLIAGTTLIGLFIGLFTMGTFGLIDAPWTDYIEMTAIGAPLWLLSLLAFFAIGIPFFFLFILGLKILVKNLKTIGTPAKLVLLGLWLLSVIGLAVIGIQQATQRAFDGEVVITETLPVTATDTLYLAMQSNPKYTSGIRRGGVSIKYDENDNKVMYATDVRLVIKSTKDSLGRMEIIKMADGSDFRDARDRAESITYNTTFNNGKLYLDSFLTSPLQNHYREQEVRVVIYLPEGATLYADSNISNFHRSSDYYGNILNYNTEGKYLKIIENGYTCEDCEEEDGDWNNDSWEEDTEDPIEENGWETDSISGEVKVRLDENGIQINNRNSDKIRINKNGVAIQKT